MIYKFLEFLSLQVCNSGTVIGPGAFLWANCPFSDLFGSLLYMWVLLPSNSWYIILIQSLHMTVHWSVRLSDDETLVMSEGEWNAIPCTSSCTLFLYFGVSIFIFIYFIYEILCLGWVCTNICNHRICPSVLYFTFSAHHWKNIHHLFCLKHVMYYFGYTHSTGQQNPKTSCSTWLCPMPVTNLCPPLFPIFFLSCGTHHSTVHFSAVYIDVRT